jgi:hypothetical protein
VAALVTAAWLLWQKIPAEEKVKARIQPPSRRIALLRLTAQKLPPAPTGKYALWWRTKDGPPQLLFEFNVTAEGMLIDEQGKELSALVLSPAQEAMLSQRPILFATVEPKHDTGELPTATRLGEEALKENAVELTLPTTELSKASAALILATPTNGKRTLEESGVWFWHPRKKRSTLSLPPPPRGWIYEAWIKNKERYLSLGRFSQAQGADLSNLFGGKRKGYAAPGEDFLQNPPAGWSFPLNLADGLTRVLISLEPDVPAGQKRGSEPYLPFFSVRIPFDYATGKLLALEGDFSEFPRLRVEILYTQE